MYEFVKEPLLYEGAVSQVYGIPMYEQVDLQQQLNDAYARGDKTFKIPRGAYRLTPKDGVGHLHLDGLTDFTVEGEEVVLLCQDLGVNGIALTDCTNVRVSGITVDFEPCGYTQGVVTALTPDYLDIFVEEGYLADLDDYQGPYLCPCDFFEQETGALYTNLRSYSSIPDGSVEDLGNRTFRLHIPTPLSMRERVRLGDFFVITRRPMMRSGFLSVGNTDCYIDHCTVWAGLCGIAESYGKTQTKISHFSVVPGPAPFGAKHGRVLSTVADGCHMAANRKGARIENSRFFACGDDCLNHYGYFSRVCEQLSPHSAIFAEMGNCPPEVGDTLRLYAATTEKIGEVRVKTVEHLPHYQPPQSVDGPTGCNYFTACGYYKIDFDGTVALSPLDWMTNADRCGNGFIFRHNYVKNIRPRGCLIKASDGAVEDNTFENIGYAGVQIKPEFEWLEAGYSHNVAVRHNTFIGCGSPSTAALVVSGQRAADQKNIIIENNTFIHNPCIEVSLAQIDGCVVRDNVFGIQRDNRDYPIIAKLSGKRLVLEGNTFPEDCVNYATTNIKEK